MCDYESKAGAKWCLQIHPAKTLSLSPHLILSSRARLRANDTAARRRLFHRRIEKLGRTTSLQPHLVDSHRATMYLSRAITTSFVCTACQKAATRTCPSASRFSSQRAFSARVSLAEVEQSTPIATEPTVDVPPEAQSALHDVKASPPAVDDAPATTQFTPSAVDTSIPWYLREQSKLREAQQQTIEIPDLPTNPPPLLKTILEYISTTAGLDSTLR